MPTVTAYQSPSRILLRMASPPHRIYLDHNGSTPTHPAAIEAMMPYLSGGFGNPSSGHWAADPARASLEDARSALGQLIEGVEITGAGHTMGFLEAGGQC